MLDVRRIGVPRADRRGARRSGVTGRDRHAGGFRVTTEL
ncbi:hypothetical protein FHR81_003704 [Actinoalloteichus hoggarensis]|uniref:Uncharacterized protein n=1 Tax=Actinoalloteichus hoggarensis TaxID=1470176 RepID=A0A221WAN8_9PSEU|nr:hypothetical protein AHOG_27220 [Actinoalloteichus hoggarensis]MBB5922647.1 hypothetical protein [Actinoalloteichus hoggarensis]